MQTRRGDGQAQISSYSRNTVIRINWDGEPAGYAENPDNWIFFENRLQRQFGCYYLQHARASKSFDHTFFEVLEAINTVMYCT